MFDIGFLELLVVAMIGLLVLGPERLPQVIKKVASWMARSRQFASHLKEEFEREANLSEMRQTLSHEKEQFKQHLQTFEKEISASDSIKPSISETIENKADGSNIKSVKEE